MDMKHLKIASEDQRLVGGEVYIPGVPDSDGEFMDADGIRDMAYRFMRAKKQEKIDVRHNNQLVRQACVVESFIARKGDPDFPEGAWCVIVHVPDDATWAAIKKGEINGFSMEAMVSKESTFLEFEVPPVIQGKTMKHEADGHEHEFYVAYDDQGNFLGGQTNIVGGHYHTIKKGTVTEMAGDHKHRFAHLDILKQASDGTVQIIKQDLTEVDLEVTAKSEEVQKDDLAGVDLGAGGAKSPENVKRSKRTRLSDFYVQI